MSLSSLSIPAALSGLSPFVTTVASGTTPAPESTNPAEEITDDVETHLPPEFEQIVTSGGPLTGMLLGIGISVVVALVVTVVTSMVAKQIFKTKPEVISAIGRSRLPLFLIVVFAGGALSAHFTGDAFWWQPALYVGFLVAVIVALAWWALRIVKVVEAVILTRYVGDGEPDIADSKGRRVQTQVYLISRILAAVIITIAVAAVLLLNESVRGLGAGLLASAGVVSVVAGLAMQSTLSNIFAGIQLAFADSIRVNDIVVIDGNFGSVEEITLSNVVIQSWDGRRFIYPSAQFAATPFENWTRVGTELMGTVEIDVDWRVPTDELRARLKRLLASTDLWDGETSALQVTEALNGHLQIRVIASALDSGRLWDLRCLIREDLVNYIRSEHPYAMVTQRMLVNNEEALTGQPVKVETGKVAAIDPADHQPGQRPEEPLGVSGDDASLFTGSISAVQRHKEFFSGPGEDVYRERRERAEEQESDDPAQTTEGESRSGDHDEDDSFSSTPRNRS